MSPLRLVILFYCACLFFMPLAKGWCYYLDQSSETPLLIRENAPQETQQENFALQDNLHLFSSTPAPSAPLLLPCSANFISADTINSNLPIFSLFRTPDTLSKDPFANILYANQRIKKLLKEYSELQQRAEALLGTTQQLGTTGLMTGYLITRDTKELSEKKIQPQDDLATALNQLKHNLATGTTTRSIVPPGTDTRPGTAANKKPILTFHELQNVLKRHSEQKSIIQQGISGGFVSSSHLTYQQLGSESDLPAQQRTGNSSYEGSGEINLPWILNLPFKLFDLAISHKIITLIMGFICLLLFNIIFGERS